MQIFFILIAIFLTFLTLLAIIIGFYLKYLCELNRKQSHMLYEIHKTLNCIKSKANE